MEIYKIEFNLTETGNLSETRNNYPLPVIIL